MGRVLDNRVRTIIHGAARFWTGEVDLASVCLFRIVFGALLFNWVWQLWPNIPALLTDEGMLPRAALLTITPPRFTLLFLSGDEWAARLLWSVGLIAAAMLAVGFRTRLASVLAFLVVTSFTSRNPFMLDSSDLVYRLVAFWLIFIPAGRRYSVDAWLAQLRGDTPKAYGPALPVRLLELQIAWVYLAAGLAKLEGATWIQGTAVYYALQLEHTVGRSYASGLARNLAFAHWATWGTLAIELAFLPLVFAPLVAAYTRTLAIAAAVLLHLSVLLLMNVGNFPFVMLASLIPFCSAAAIERFMGGLRGLAPSRPAPATSETAVQPGLMPIWAPARATVAKLSRGMGLVILACGAALAFATALPPSLQAYRPEGAILDGLVYAGLDQNWGMFAPNPSNDDGWLAAPARLSDGTDVDLISPRNVGDSPRFADPLYSRWTKVTEWLSTNPPAGFLLEYGRMRCRLYNGQLQPGEPSLQRFDLIYVDRVIAPPGQSAFPINRRLLWTHTC